MFINVKAARERIMGDIEELEGLFTSLGFREGLFWLERDASKGEIEFVGSKDLYRTLSERGEGKCDPYDPLCNYVPMEKLYNQLGLGPVFKKILAARTQSDFPYDSITYFEQGFVDAVRHCRPLLIDEEIEEEIEACNSKESFPGADEASLTVTAEERANDLHGEEEHQG